MIDTNIRWLEIEGGIITRDCERVNNDVEENQDSAVLHKLNQEKTVMVSQLVVLKKMKMTDNWSLDLDVEGIRDVEW
jgi:hypothetical protein